MSRDYLPMMSVETFDEILDELGTASDIRKENLAEKKGLVNLWEHGYNMAIENIRTALERGTVFDVLKDNLLEQINGQPRVYISEEDKIPAQAFPADSYKLKFDCDAPISVGIGIKDMPDEIAINDVFYKKE